MDITSHVQIENKLKMKKRRVLFGKGKKEMKLNRSAHVILLPSLTHTQHTAHIMKCMWNKITLIDWILNKREQVDEKNSSIVSLFFFAVHELMKMNENSKISFEYWKKPFKRRKKLWGKFKALLMRRKKLKLYWRQWMLFCITLQNKDSLIWSFSEVCRILNHT